MALSHLQYMATVRQVEILEETLKGLPAGEDATRSSELHRASLEGLIATLTAQLDEADLAALAILLAAAHQDTPA